MRIRAIGSEQVAGLIGVESAEALQAMIAAARKPSSGILATILGLATLLFGATGVFGELQESLNSVWGVKPKPGRGIRCRRWSSTSSTWPSRSSS